jgi:hypothetical protein
MGSASLRILRERERERGRRGDWVGRAHKFDFTAVY